jgi:actin-like ATPase involved in cell morphogenesis
MSYYLGVDLGTTYTAAAVWRDGHVEITGLGNRAPTIPSVVLLRDDGSMLVGEAAERRAVVEPHRVAREFKRRIGDPTPIVIGGTPYSADALTAKVLRWVVDKVTETEGGAPTGVAITYPANWGDYKTDLLRQAITLADLDRVATVTEPEAAAIHYASQERVEQGSVIAVYDLGGGTFDAAVLRKTATGWDILGEPQGVERLGGVDFDEAVFQHVVATLDGAIESLDPDDPTALGAVARLRFECVDAKEALSTDTEVTIPVLLPNVQTEVRLTRSELEQMVRPALVGSLTAFSRALRSAGVEVTDVGSVLLVGGSSRMPLVAQLVASELGRPVAVDTHPKYSVALGAAVLAAGRDVADAVDRSRIGAVPGEPPAGGWAAGAGFVGGVAEAAAGGAAAAAQRPSPPAPYTPAPASQAGPAGPPTAPAGGGWAQAGSPSPGYAPTSGYGTQPGYGQAPSGGYSSGGYSSGGYQPPSPSTGSTGSRTGLLLAIGGIAAVALIVALVVAMSGGDEEDPAASTTTTEDGTTTTGDGVTTTTGTDTPAVEEAELQDMQTSCESGAMLDCDALWMLSPVDSEFEAYAMTCGDRDTTGEHAGTCDADFPEETGLPIDLSDTALERLRGACGSGYFHYCDMLFWRSPADSDLEAFAENCGGRAPEGETYAGQCQVTYGTSATTTTTAAG